MKLVIGNGELALSDIGEIKKGSIYIDDGKIVAIKLGGEKREMPAGFENAKKIDATGKLVTPGFIDLHVHFREPGFEYKETIKTGSMAAAAGGYTTVCMMPNTKPTIDNVETLKYIEEKTREHAKINVLTIGSITKGQLGKELSDIESMSKYESKSKKLIEKGICAVSEDGRSVMNSAIMLSGIKKAKENNLTVFSHTEDENLPESTIGEELIAVRDMMLAEEVGAPIHLCHISTQKCVRAIEYMKSQGLKVTAEVTPHHLILDENMDKDNTNYKMNPPLRSKDDVVALRKALKTGIIDVIATDHAPHSEEEKKREYLKAPNGIVGLETAFALCYTELVRKGDFSTIELVDAMTKKPAYILGIDSIGTLEVGKYADITIIDIEKPYKIDKTKFLSKGINTPFDGFEVYGKIEKTIVSGELVYSK